MSQSIANFFRSAPSVDAEYALSVYCLVPIFPILLGTWWIKYTRRYVWRGGRVKKFFCYLSTVIYEYAPAVALGNFVFAAIICLNQGSAFYDRLGVSSDISYYTRVNGRVYQNFELYQSAVALNSVNVVRTDFTVEDVGNRRRQLRSSGDILSIFYHTETWENLLVDEDRLRRVCRSEVNIMNNVDCISGSVYQSIIPSIFNMSNCDYLMPFDDAVYLFGEFDNSLYRADRTVYSSTSTPIVVSYFEVGSCHSMPSDDFRDQIKSNTQGDITATFVSREFVEKEMKSISYNGFELAMLACLLGFIMLMVMSRGIVVTTFTGFCIFFSLLNSAALMTSLDYDKLSAMNLIGVLVLLTVGISYVTLFGSAFREFIRKGLNATHLTILEVYLTVAQSILLTTIACCLVFFSLATSDIVFVRQLGSFLGISMVLFYINFHYIIIPMWLFTSWYALPRSFHMRVKMMRRFCCEKILAAIDQLAFQDRSRADVIRRYGHGSDSSSEVEEEEEEEEEQGAGEAHHEGEVAGEGSERYEEKVDDYHDDGDYIEEATVVAADQVRFASPGQEEAAALAVRAVPAGVSAVEAIPDDEEIDDEHTQVVLEDGSVAVTDVGAGATHSAADGYSAAASQEQVRPAEAPPAQAPPVEPEQRPPGRSMMSRMASIMVGHWETEPELEERGIEMQPRRGATATATATAGTAAAAPDAFEEPEYPCSSCATIDLCEGKLPLKWFGFFILGITLMILMISVIFGMELAEFNYRLPQMFPSQSNIGEAFDIFRYYKADIFSTIENDNDAVLATVTAMPTFMPTAAPTNFSEPTLAPTVSVPSFTPTRSPVQGLSDSDYQDFVIYTCWGINKRDEAIDSDLVPDFDISKFRGYMSDGMLDDMDGFCSFVENNRNSLDVHPEWDRDRDCIYQQTVDALDSDFVTSFAPEIPVAAALSYMGLQTYTNGNLIGLLSNNERDAATPVWVCGNFTLRSESDPFREEPGAGRQLKRKWDDAFRSRGSRNAQKQDVRSFVTGFEFSYSLLDNKVDRNIEYMTVVICVGFALILWLFTLSDFGLTVFGSLGMVTIFSFSLFLGINIIDNTLDLNDYIAIAVSVPMLMNYPINLIEDYIASRSFYERNPAKDTGEWISPALRRTNRYARMALLQPTIVSVVVSVPFLSARLPLLRRLAEYTILISLTAFLFTILIQPYLFAFGCKTRICDTYCTYYDDDYYEDYRRYYHEQVDNEDRRGSRSIDEDIPPPLPPLSYGDDSYRPPLVSRDSFINDNGSVAYSEHQSFYSNGVPGDDRTIRSTNSGYPPDWPSVYDRPGPRQMVDDDVTYYSEDTRGSQYFQRPPGGNARQPPPYQPYTMPPRYEEIERDPYSGRHRPPNSYYSQPMPLPPPQQLPMQYDTGYASGALSPDARYYHHYAGPPSPQHIPVSEPPGPLRHFEDDASYDMSYDGYSVGETSITSGDPSLMYGAPPPPYGGYGYAQQQYGAPYGGPPPPSAYDRPPPPATYSRQPSGYGRGGYGPPPYPRGPY